MLPPIDDPEQLAALRGELGPWTKALEQVAARHGIAGAPSVATSGTQPVFVYPNVVVKLYAPPRLWDAAAVGPSDHEVERGTLTRLAGTAVPAPRLRGEGEVGGWPYLVFTRLRGRPVETWLRQAAGGAAQTMMRDLGETVAALHALPTEGVTTALPDFDAFLHTQARDIVDIERARGAPTAWLEPMRRFVDGTPRGTTTRALLHTELGPAHALVADGKLQGIIDWAETLVGDAEYDIAAVAFFIARGDGARLGAFLDGYGWTGVRGQALAERLLRYLLLHRYAPLAWLLKERPVSGVPHPKALAATWMGLA